VCCRSRGAPPSGSGGAQCHLTAGAVSVHLTRACQQYIAAPGICTCIRANTHTHTHTLTHAYVNLQRPEISVWLLSASVTVPCVSRAGLWWAALCLWLVSRLKAALCIPAVGCAPEPEDWAVCGAPRRKPAGPQRQSEYCRNISENWKPSKNEHQRQTAFSKPVVGLAICVKIDLFFFIVC